MRRRRRRGLEKLFRRDKTVAIVTFNVENLFDLVGEPAGRSAPPTPYQFEAKLEKLSLAISDELDFPDILVTQEIKNQAVLQAIGDRANTRGSTAYRAVSFETSDPRGIEVGLLFDTKRARLIEAYQLSGADVELAFGRASPKPGREPVVGVFECMNQLLTVVGNHFKSRGGDVPLPGPQWPPEGSTEAQRKEQARVVRAFADRTLGRDPQSLLIVAGDFNDFRYGAGDEVAEHPLTILEGTGAQARLYDVVDDIPEDERFTFDYWGRKQVLDHVLLSPAAYQRVREVRIPHFNAGFPRKLAEDLTTAIRCSDHDPVVVTIDLD